MGGGPGAAGHVRRGDERERTLADQAPEHGHGLRAPDLIAHGIAHGVGQGIRRIPRRGGLGRVPGRDGEIGVARPLGQRRGGAPLGGRKLCCDLPERLPGPGWPPNSMAWLERSVCGARVALE